MDILGLERIKIDFNKTKLKIKLYKNIKILINIHAAPYFEDYIIKSKKLVSRYRHIVDAHQGLARANSRIQTQELCASPNTSNY